MAKQLELKDKRKLGEVVIVESVRADGSRRIQQDFSACPTLAEQHTAHMTDINYLMEKYQPDELAAYIAARAAYRQEILGHDFSTEPSMQDAMNIVYRSRVEFNNLDEDIRNKFKNHVEFLKFIDNPDNAEKMIKYGILKPRQVEALKGNDTTSNTTTTTTTSSEEKKEK